MITGYSEADSQNTINASVMMAVCQVCILTILIAYMVGAVRSGADNKPTAERMIAERIVVNSPTMRQIEKTQCDDTIEYSATEGITTLLKVNTMTRSHPLASMMDLLAEVLRKGGWCGEYKDATGKFRLQYDLEVDPAWVSSSA